LSVCLSVSCLFLGRPFGGWCENSDWLANHLVSRINASQMVDRLANCRPPEWVSWSVDDRLAITQKVGQLVRSVCLLVKQSVGLLLGG
jgi:hypothetical protein